MSASTSLTVSQHDAASSGMANISQFVTVYLGGQLFGFPVLSVQDVLRSQNVANVPLAKKEISGLLNLRGRIVTAIDLRKRLGMPPLEDIRKVFNVVVEHKGDLYSLLVDKVGDVMSLGNENFEKCPANLEQNLRDVSSGIYRLKSELLVILDVEKILTF